MSSNTNNQSCSKCRLRYDSNSDHFPVSLTCGHSFCTSCFFSRRTGSLSCPTCAKMTSESDGENQKQDVNSETSELARSRRETELLRLENEVLREVVRKTSETGSSEASDDEVTCSCCAESYNEHRMYICRDCSISMHVSTVVESKNPNAKLYIRSVSLCSNCAIQNHVVKKHAIMKLYPLLAHFQSIRYSESIKSMGEMFTDEIAEIGEQWKKVMLAGKSFQKHVNISLKLVEKSPSSTHQKEIVDIIKDEYDDFIDTIKSMKQDFLKHEQELVNKIQAFNSKIMYINKEEIDNDQETSMEIANLLEELELE